jgi:hypothetical protein
MKHTILLLIFLCLFSFHSFAQKTFTVKGIAADSAIKLAGTTVTVINAKDSILRAFAWTDEKGAFNISGLSKGKFLIIVNYPGYAAYTDEFSLDSAKSTFDFGTISMILKTKLLQEVIIKGSVTAIKIKGDTTEYNAKAYKIQPNDKVEDLLKQLPGIEVDKDGKITAQGQTVTKVLVDGEEFFGDDPTLVTKNIRADMVDKVQVYDKKSDQAAFTGIDDGVKDKTINIKLKADKKNGYFGRANAGIGTDGYYDNQLLFNKFENKEKIAVYGTLSNTGKTGLGWQDNQKLGTNSDNVQYGDDGSVSIFFSGNGDDLDSFDGTYNGQGLPIARTAGAHYDDKWNNDKESINTNYKTGSLTVDGISTNNVQQNFPDSANTGQIDSIIRTNTYQKYHKFLFRQKLDATYTVAIDTTQNLKISVDGTEKHSDVNEDNNSSSFINTDTLNTNHRSVLNHVDEKLFNASAFYTKKFHKKGRTLSFLVSEGFDQVNSTGYLNAQTHYYTNNTLDSLQLTDQQKTLATKNSVLKTNLTYTEPLSKKFALALNYGVSVDNGTSQRFTYDSTAFNGHPVYNQIVDSLSSDYKIQQVSNQGGAILNYKLDKTTFNFGTRVSDVTLTQTDLFAGAAPFKRHFIDWLPQATYQYRFSQQQSIRISYNGNTTQPTITQLEPVKNNNDNLNITEGNPDLKPSFNNRINFNYNSYKVISGQDLGIYGSYNFTFDPIVSNTSTNLATDQTIYKSVNLPGKTQTNFYAGSYYDQKVKVAKQSFDVGFNLNANGGTSYNYTNGALNTTNNYTYSVTLNIQQYKVKKYNFYVNFGPTYTFSNTSLQPGVNNNGIGYQGYSGFNIYLPFKFQIGSDANYQFTGKTESFNSDFSKLILNSNIAKTFLKDDVLKLSVSGNDLLNQNVGFSRTAQGNTITQNNYTSIKRFFMLSVSWDFNHVGGGPSK